MAVPKKKKSKSRRNMRRSHHRSAVSGISICQNCKSFKVPHHICKACGFYSDKKII